MRSPPDNTVAHSNKTNEHDIKFINNLRRLGPVRVEHSVPPASPISSSKISSDFSPQSTARAMGLTPTVPVQTLHDLLDRRNSVFSSSEVAAFAETHGLGQTNFNQLIDVVNSPSIRVVSGNRDSNSSASKESLRQIALWFDPNAKPKEP